jgi:hypothetical protein
MSINESILKQLTTLEQSMAEQMAAMAEMRKALGMGELALPGKAKKARKSKASSAASDAGSAAEPKEAKAPSAWNTLVASTVAEMKQSGWESWTDLKGVSWPASRRGTVKDKSGAEREAFVFDGGEHDGKEPSPALGGMVRASFLKAQSDPAAAEKARAYHAKLAEKRSASASTGSGEREEPVADAEGAPVAKKSGRPKMTDEQKAAAKVKREAKKAAEAAAPKAEPEAEEDGEFSDVPEEAAPPAPAAAPAPSAPPAPPAAQPKKVLMKPKAAAPPPPKKLDLTFFPWTYDGKKYITNDRGDVIEPEEGQWVGRFNGKSIDTSVPEPDDLEGVEMRE